MSKAVSTDLIELEKQFAHIEAIINRHRTTAIATVNVESLLTAWEVGRYISIKLKSAQWGSKVVSDLADYLKRQNPKRRGFGKRHLYNMVNFYDTYCTDDFCHLCGRLKLGQFVQLPIAQIDNNDDSGEIVQLPIAQLEESLVPMPNVLTLITFTCHLEIMNRCRTYEERVFYMLYAAHQRLKTEELRRSIVNQTYSTLLDKDKMMSPSLREKYPQFGIILCPSADRSMVEYTLSRSLSPTMVAEYQSKLIPQEVMQRSLEEYCAFLDIKLCETN